MKWVGDVVALVDRSPQRAVGRERQAVTVAHACREHAHAPVRRPVGEHRGTRVPPPRPPGAGVRRAAGIDVHRVVASDYHVLQRMRAAVREVPDHHRSRSHGVALPLVSVELVGLGDVQHLMTAKTVECHALGVGEARPECAFQWRPVAASARYELGDGASRRPAHEQIALGRPGLQASPGHQRPHFSGPATQQRHRVRAAKAAVSRWDLHGDARVIPWAAAPVDTVVGSCRGAWLSHPASIAVSTANNVGTTAVPRERAQHRREPSLTSPVSAHSRRPLTRMRQASAIINR